ncbi:MAG: YvcK family protein [Candidatus Kerfeldbacteria bacterium]|nr:YvcK family protein [Candidatus Kerfeldbacteria bacterium]
MTVRPRIVTIGGGSGMSRVVQGLARLPIDLSVIVSTSDDGGSTGVLVREYGILSPGDIRQNLSALSSHEAAAPLLEHRFVDGPIAGHPLGNLMVTAAFQKFGVEQGIETLRQLWGVSVDLSPGTLTPHGAMVRIDGVDVAGQFAVCYDPRLAKASEIQLSTNPSVSVNPRCPKVIAAADLILIGPGNLYGTILWNFTYRGMVEALQSTRARIVVMANLMNSKAQLPHGTVADLIERIERVIGKLVTDVVYQDPPLSSDVLQKATDYETPVVGLGNLPSRVQAHPCDLIGASPRLVATSDQLKNVRTHIRHDPEKSATAVLQLLDKRR